MSQASFRAVCPIPSSAIVASADKEVRKRILRRLRAQRWTVEEAMGGAEALSLVEDGVFGALLLDRWLPDLEVSELVEIIKARHPQVQVMLLGSEAEERFLLERLSESDALPMGFPEARRWRRSLALVSRSLHPSRRRARSAGVKVRRTY